MPKRFPLEDDYLVFSEGGAEMRLVGSYSPAADVTFFPQRKRCPITEQAVNRVELSTEGTLFSWSFIHMPRMGSMQLDPDGGYGIGQIDLPEGVRIQAPIDGPQDQFRIGMRMQLAPNVMHTDPDGNEYCGFKFVPVNVSEDAT